ncbi:hypothetical protein MMC06_003139 [Schaereria dolodes]|nr:hypothetical protein [Schaereria dolodes]
MPSENHNNGAKARTMAYSALPSRIHKSPFVTPKMAGSPILCTSPTPRKSIDSPIDETPKSATGEEMGTPVRAFMNSNITPRSGPRKARVDSASSTPNETPKGTPRGSRPVSMIQTHEQAKDGIYGLDAARVKGAPFGRIVRSGSVVSDGRSSSSFRTASAERRQIGQELSNPQAPPKFFHASDAPSTLPRKRLQEPIVQAKTSSFVYADGKTEGQPTWSAHSSIEDTEEHSATLFRRTPDLEHSIQPSTSFTKSSPYVSPDHSPLQNSIKTKPKVAPPRSPSPLKDVQIARTASLSKASPRRHSRLVSNTGPHKIELSLSDVNTTNQTDLRRRCSIGSSPVRRIAHTKSLSVSSVDPGFGRGSSLRISDGSNLTTEPKTISVELDSLNHGEDSVDIPLKKDSGTIPRSPTGPTGHTSRLDHLNELAANARRERKVLDLEISNSSLLAINRTLECEMRKQNAELRRLRRLSRTGRLSMVSSSRSVTSRYSTFSGLDGSNDISGMSEHEDELDLSEDEDDVSLGSASYSPAAQVEHSARLRAKDEKRQWLDLTRHQELLIDSQKMNQSLKRCLGWTEDLITEGRKALDYRVLVDDMGVVGGRVLTPDETGGHVMHGHGLLSPVHEISSDPLEAGLGIVRSADGENHDRDSGIDLLHSPIHSPIQLPMHLPDSKAEDAGLSTYLESLRVSWGI